MSRYFVIWCLEDDIEAAIDSFERHGQPVGDLKISRHDTTGLYAGSAEVLPKGDDDVD